MLNRIIKHIFERDEEKRLLIAALLFTITDRKIRNGMSEETFNYIYELLKISGAYKVKK